MRVTGINQYGTQGSAIKRNNNDGAKYTGFFQEDSFMSVRTGSVEINNYYTKNVKSSAPYPSSNCYVEDVKGAQEALDKLKAEADSFDYTGMSDGEIFMSIFDRYKSYFGEDFLNINWQQNIIDKKQLNKENVEMAYKIRDQFSKERSSKVKNREEAYAYYYGYDGMSKEEMKAAIYGEFAVCGGTYASFYKMVDKLFLTGLISREEESALMGMMDKVQMNKGELFLSTLFYEKYGSLLQGYYEGMNIDEILNIFDRVLKNSTYEGNGAETLKAADENARDILRELREVMKAANLGN